MPEKHCHKESVVAKTVYQMTAFLSTLPCHRGFLLCRPRGRDRRHGPIPRFRECAALIRASIGSSVLVFSPLLSLERDMSNVYGVFLFLPFIGFLFFTSALPNMPCFDSPVLR